MRCVETQRFSLRGGRSRFLGHPYARCPLQHGKIAPWEAPRDAWESVYRLIHEPNNADDVSIKQSCLRSSFEGRLMRVIFVIDSDVCEVILVNKTNPSSYLLNRMTILNSD